MMNDNSSTIETADQIVKSSFNNAVYKNIRINNLWELCNKYSRNGELEKWKWVLDVIWRELSAPAKKKNKQLYFEEITRLNINIAKYRTDKTMLYNSLNEKDIYLRILEDDLGLGIKWYEEQYDDF